MIISTIWFHVVEQPENILDAMRYIMVEIKNIGMGNPFNYKVGDILLLHNTEEPDNVYKGCYGSAWLEQGSHSYFIAAIESPSKEITEEMWGRP